MAMQSPLSPAADMLPHWLWAESAGLMILSMRPETSFFSAFKKIKGGARTALLEARAMLIVRAIFLFRSVPTRLVLNGRGTILLRVELIGFSTFTPRALGQP
jgi:hypothetical protein